MNLIHPELEGKDLGYVMDLIIKKANDGWKKEDLIGWGIECLENSSYMGTIKGFSPYGLVGKNLFNALLKEGGAICGAYNFLGFQLVKPR